MDDQDRISTRLRPQHSPISIGYLSFRSLDSVLDSWRIISELVYQPSALAEIEGSYFYVFKRVPLVYKVMDPNTTELVLSILDGTYFMDDTTELPWRDWLGSVSGDIISRKASYTNQDVDLTSLGSESC